MAADAERIADIRLDDRLVKRRSPDIEHEMAVAIYDLIEASHFVPAGAPPGPYRVGLEIRDGRSLVFHIEDGERRPLDDVAIALSPFRRIVKDYFTVCESYFDAIKTAPPSRIETIDMGRRGLHDEGAALLRRALEARIEIDDETARRLFTLICVLHIRA